MRLVTATASACFVHLLYVMAWRLPSQNAVGDAGNPNGNYMQYIINTVANIKNTGKKGDFFYEEIPMVVLQYGGRLALRECCD